MYILKIHLINIKGIYVCITYTHTIQFDQIHTIWASVTHTRTKGWQWQYGEHWRGQRMGLHPCLIWFFLALFLPCMHDEENFLTWSSAYPSGPHKAPPHSVKFYFLLICPTTATILIKLVSLIKIYLKLQLNLSHKINLIFSKNWIILSKCLTRQYHNKKKNVIV